MQTTNQIGTTCLVGLLAASVGGLAHGQATTGGAPNASYTPLHAWYDVSQSVGIFENNVGIYNDEILVDVRDTATGTGTHRGNTYGTNVETWAQFGGAWARTGGFTGSQNGMTTWEVRNGAGIGSNSSNTANGTWEDADGSIGIGNSGGYTVMMTLNIHEATSYNGVWNLEPAGPNDDTPILNGNTDIWNTGATTAAQPGKGLLWIDADRTGQAGATWVMDAGSELVSAPVTFDQWQVHTFVYDGANSQHYINGAMVASGDAGSDAMVGLDMWVTSGGWHRAGNLDFAEGLFYDEVLSGSDRATLETYLMDRWGIVTIDLDGDLNNDGFVGAADLDLLMAHWGTANAIADEDGSGTVGQGDLDIVTANWGNGTAPGGVPEPGSLALLGLAGLALTRRRPRH
ncbi:PEP-CTERM sorting domain-containing protein [Phycisphaeraceae bacterium D3-23]